jgi:acyl carrier protein
MSNAEVIRSYIVDNFLFGDDEGFDTETSFLENGIIDSTGIMELVDFIEKKFNLKVDDEELIPENLDSILNIVNFLKEKINS